MTKSSTALMSLIAAVPGAVLALLLVWAFLGHADAMGGTLNAVVGIALLCGVAAALMPVGIVIFGGPKGPAKPKAAKPPKEPKPKKEKKSKKKGKDEPVEDSSDDLEESSGEIAAESSEELDEFDTSDSGETSDEFEHSGDTLKPKAAGNWDEPSGELSDEFEFDDALSDDELEFDFDDDDDDR